MPPAYRLVPAVTSLSTRLATLEQQVARLVADMERKRRPDTLTAQAAWERAYNLLGFNGTDAFKGQWDWRLCALEGAALLLDGWRP